MPRYLQGELHVRIGLLCREGDEHAAAGEMAEALACYTEAWELVPEPREQYADAAPILLGFTRVLRARGDLASGLELLLGSRSRIAPAVARSLARDEG